MLVNGPDQSLIPPKQVFIGTISSFLK